MTKSELIERLAKKFPQKAFKDVESPIKGMIEYLGECLAAGRRIEIRGFGSFVLRHRNPRVGRNPKTGDQVTLGAKSTAHFKPGKELRERVNAGSHNPITSGAPDSDNDED